MRYETSYELLHLVDLTHQVLEWPGSNGLIHVVEVAVEKHVHIRDPDPHGATVFPRRLWILLYNIADLLSPRIYCSSIGATQHTKPLFCAIISETRERALKLKRLLRISVLNINVLT